MNLRDLLRRLTADPVRPAGMSPLIHDAARWTEELATVHEKAAETNLQAAEVERLLENLRREAGHG